MGNDNSTQLSDIKVHVNTSVNYEEASVSAKGSVVTYLTAKDFDIFNIYHSNLLKGANKIPKPDYLSGLSVSKAFPGVREPLKFNIAGPSTWNVIKKTIRPVQAKIIKVYSEPAIAARRKFTNNSSVKGKYRVGVTHEEENKITTKWTRNIDFNLDLKIDYKIVKPEASGDITFKSSWGKETNKLEAVTLGSETAVEVDLNPGQSVVAKLRLIRCVMDVEVTYEASLDGDVICLYESIWKPFSWHYVNHNINDVLRAGNQATSLSTTEVMKICFCTDGEILLSDN